jgi:hypothetical protein
VGRPVVAYNMGFPGSGYFGSLFTLRRLLADGICPDLLVLELLPAYLVRAAPGDLGPEVVPRRWLRLHEMRLIRAYDSLRESAPWRPWVEAQLVPVWSHRTEIVQSLLPWLLPDDARTDALADIDTWGARPSPTVVPADLRERETRRAEVQYRDDAFRGFPPSEDTYRQVEQLLGLCQDNRIPVVVVFMPEGPLFRSWYTPAAETAVAAFEDRLRQRGVFLIDARPWFAEELFIDSHHLVAAGSVGYTRRLGAAIKHHLAPAALAADRGGRHGS